MCEWKWWWEGSCAASSWRWWRSLVAWTSSRTWMWSCATLATPSAGAATLSCRGPRCCLHRRRPPHRCRTNTVSLTLTTLERQNSIYYSTYTSSLSKKCLCIIFLTTVFSWQFQFYKHKNLPNYNYIIFYTYTRVKGQVNAVYLHNSIVLKVLQLWVSGVFDLFLTNS